MVDWDKRYREGFYKGTLEPHGFLKRYWHLIPMGNVIDIAMGPGRDAIFLAEKGYRVYGIDRSYEAIRIAKRAIDRCQGNIQFIQADMAHLPIKRAMFDGCLVFYFFPRGMLQDITSLLKKDGMLIYETFLKRQNLIDRWRDPEYLLDDGELITSLRDIEPLFYEEVISCPSDKRRAIARFVGRKI